MLSPLRTACFCKKSILFRVSILISICSEAMSYSSEPCHQSSLLHFRVTWLASEGLTNYLRRVIQDEKSREINLYHSYQDFSAIPENNVEKKTDSKGRRLSYQRAVSGEDPRYLESNVRRKQLIPENSEVNKLNTFTLKIFL